MDWDEVLTLMQVHEKASGHPGILTDIANRAMAELKDWNEEAKKPKEDEDEDVPPSPVKSGMPTTSQTSVDVGRRP